jgi:hypothetical protein
MWVALVGFGGAGVTGDSSLSGGLVVDVDIGAARTTPDPTSTTRVDISTPLKSAVLAPKS